MTQSAVQYLLQVADDLTLGQQEYLASQLSSMLSARKPSQIVTREDVVQLVEETKTN